MTQPLADAVRALYPQAVINIDYLLMDDGSGPRIAQWNLPTPQPTQAELDAAPIPLDKQIRDDADYQSLKTAIKNKTPAQMRQYVVNNVNSLADARELLIKMLILLALLHR